MANLLVFDAFLRRTIPLFSTTHQSRADSSVKPSNLMPERVLRKKQPGDQASVSGEWHLELHGASSLPEDRGTRRKYNLHKREGGLLSLHLRPLSTQILRTVKHLPVVGLVLRVSRMIHGLHTRIPPPILYSHHRLSLPMMQTLRPLTHLPEMRQLTCEHIQVSAASSLLMEEQS